MSTIEHEECEACEDGEIIEPQYQVWMQYDWVDAKESDRYLMLITDDKFAAISHATQLLPQLHAGMEIRIHSNRIDERKS